MAFVNIPQGWKIRESLVTPESTYLNRREFVKAVGIAGVGLWARCADGKDLEEAGTPEIDMGSPTLKVLHPAKRNELYTVGRNLTKEGVSENYNNFYEFSPNKEQVKDLVGGFVTHPWKIEVSGHVKNPGTYDLDDLAKRLNFEERVYRFRCVEAWAMTVPWTGFPLKDLLDMVKPTSSAKFVRFVTFMNPEQAPGQATQPWYPWPYFEGLRMDEAMNELSFLATGIYGKPMPKQHGAPIRLVVPWKYGYKSIKSIVSIELVDRQPPTFWNDLAPREYDFWSNVNPEVPHPRWSQASERLIGTGERVPTDKFNGYGDYVAQLYG
jgi:sulfoxide reductase catalytic subunit YedY